MTTTADTVLARDSGGVGIGVSPTAGVKLDVNGNVKVRAGNMDVGGNVIIRGGTPAAGLFLKSTDSNGTAVWAAPTATYAP
jgi:hypothetical protein